MAGALDLVEQKLSMMAASEVDVASSLATRMFSAGGKRIRPMLVVLSGMACGMAGDDARLVDLAAATELVHTASLIHDDVIDETAERRGVATTSAIWGNKLSVLGGDFMLSGAFSLLSGIGNWEVLRALSAMAVGMSESEMLQALSEGSIQLWEANYWRIIHGKTARFMGVCCECGAVLAEASSPVQSALAEFGLQVGLAFQITDDLLDIAGDPALTGKDIGTDLIHGKYTLPILTALRHQEVGSQCRELLGHNGSLTAAQARQVADLVEQCGAADEARRSAYEHSRQAISCLDALPASEHRSALESLAASIVDRII